MPAIEGQSLAVKIEKGARASSAVALIESEDILSETVEVAATRGKPKASGNSASGRWVGIDHTDGLKDDPRFDSVPDQQHAKGCC